MASERREPMTTEDRAALRARAELEILYAEKASFPRLAALLRDLLAALDAPREGPQRDEPSVMGGALAKTPAPMPDRNDLFEIALSGADKALPVLITMLQTAGLKQGLVVADEIWGNVKCALKVHRESRADAPREGPGSVTTGASDDSEA